MSSWYSAIFVEPWPWWAGGTIIGLLIPLLYYTENTALGVSTGYGSILKALFPASRLKWLNSKFADGPGWRLFFLSGMVLGAFVSARLAGLPLLTTEMGIFTANVDWSLLGTGAFFLLGGVLLGLGARIAGGCTSGHSIHGLANLQLSSAVATLGFIAAGIVATYLVRTLILGGAL
ncbi:MAG: YeeE/YedE thiosulfate transporter family protein [Bacillota bacterium]